MMTSVKRTAKNFSLVEKPNLIFSSPFYLIPRKILLRWVLAIMDLIAPRTLSSLLFPSSILHVFLPFFFRLPISLDGGERSWTLEPIPGTRELFLSVIGPYSAKGTQFSWKKGIYLLLARLNSPYVIRLINVRLALFYEYSFTHEKSQDYNFQ